MKNKTIEIEAKVKAFTGQSVRNHKVAIYADGTVRVWDDVAGHYTTCHAISSSTQARLRRMAKEVIA